MFSPFFQRIIGYQVLERRDGRRPPEKCGKWGHEKWAFRPNFPPPFLPFPSHSGSCSHMSHADLLMIPHLPSFALFSHGRRGTQGPPDSGTFSADRACDDLSEGAHYVAIGCPIADFIKCLITRSLPALWSASLHLLRVPHHVTHHVTARDPATCRSASAACHACSLCSGPFVVPHDAVRRRGGDHRCGRRP